MSKPTSIDINNGNSIIRVSKTEFKGKNYIDIRKYYKNENEEWKPTPKGIAFAPELIGDIIGALNKL